MSNCIYCGEKAGLFSSKHNQCEINHNNGVNEIVKTASEAITQGGDLNDIEKRIEFIADANYIKETNALILRGLKNGLDAILDDHILSPEEDDRLTRYQNHFNISNEKMLEMDPADKLAHAIIIRDLNNGEIFDLRSTLQHVPFNFIKDEKLIWVDYDVSLYEQRTKTHYEGGYSGVSMRIAKGLYYRTGSFRGNPVKTTQMTFIDTGTIGYTDINIYFSSPTKSFRVAYDKIVTFDPYEDGIGIHKDGASAKPQIFSNIDGWFVYNLIQIVMKL
jgi:hypothetical protein